MNQSKPVASVGETAANIEARLRAHPELLPDVVALLDIVELKRADTATADQAEGRVPATLQQLGQKTLGAWGTQRQAQVGARHAGRGAAGGRMRRFADPAARTAGGRRRGPAHHAAGVERSTFMRRAGRRHDAGARRRHAGQRGGSGRTLGTNRPRRRAGGADPRAWRGRRRAVDGRAIRPALWWPRPLLGGLLSRHRISGRRGANVCPPLGGGVAETPTSAIENQSTRPRPARLGGACGIRPARKETAAG